ncbi:MAG: hypothetical protein R3207_09835 [Oceanospirillum sp.]|nr:hypothetical protein [Oceanospirillum sp.]
MIVLIVTPPVFSVGEKAASATLLASLPTLLLVLWGLAATLFQNALSNIDSPGETAHDLYQKHLIKSRAICRSAKNSPSDKPEQGETKTRGSQNKGKSKHGDAAANPGRIQEGSE